MYLKLIQIQEQSFWKEDEGHVLKVTMQDDFTCTLSMDVSIYTK